MSVPSTLIVAVCVPLVRMGVTVTVEPPPPPDSAPVHARTPVPSCQYTGWNISSSMLVALYAVPRYMYILPSLDVGSACTMLSIVAEPSALGVHLRYTEPGNVSEKPLAM